MINRNEISVSVVALGCSKNLVDAECMSTKLREAGYKISDSSDDSEVVVINTCGFIEAAKKEAIDTILKAGDLYVILEDIQDPGNLGTIMRTAEGAGAAGIIMSKGCVDIYNPKTIRSTMGSAYRVPFLYVDDLKTAIEKIRSCEIEVFAAHLNGKTYYDDINYHRAAFLIGNEGNGLSDEVANQATSYLKIPMEGQLESLNASVAASILMYEASRQRR